MILSSHSTQQKQRNGQIKEKNCYSSIISFLEEIVKIDIGLSIGQELEKSLN